MRLLVAGLALVLGACTGDDEAIPKPTFTVATFNTGTSEAGHGAVADDGYGPEQAKLSDAYYGDGLAWLAVMEETRIWFSESSIDVVGFQEIFDVEECAAVPSEARPGFVCESWKPGDPSVAERLLGAEWQVACHLDHADKCLGVRKAFGKIRGCDAELCLDGLAGAEVSGCGSGSRIGRAVIDLARGGSITVVNVHGSSGIAQADQDCRVKQLEQVFVDLDGEPAANGERNVILGDFNTDPGRMADFDESAALLNQHAGPGKPFAFVTAVGADATPTYAGLFNIDHVLSDAFGGSFFVPGASEKHPPVSKSDFFDHKPHVARLSAR